MTIRPSFLQSLEMIMGFKQEIRLQQEIANSSNPDYV